MDNKNLSEKNPEVFFGDQTIPRDAATKDAINWDQLILGVKKTELGVLPRFELKAKRFIREEWNV